MAKVGNWGVTADRSYRLVAILSPSVSRLLGGASSGRTSRSGTGGAGIDCRPSCVVANDARDESGENLETRLGLAVYADGPVLAIEDAEGGFRLEIDNGATDDMVGRGGGTRSSSRSNVSSSTHNEGEIASLASANSGTARPLLTRFRRSEFDGYNCLGLDPSVRGDKVS